MRSLLHLNYLIAPLYDSQDVHGRLLNTIACLIIKTCWITRISGFFAGNLSSKTIEKQQFKRREGGKHNTEAIDCDPVVPGFGTCVCGSCDLVVPGLGTYVCGSWHPVVPGFRTCICGSCNPVVPGFGTCVCGNCDPVAPGFGICVCGNWQASRAWMQTPCKMYFSDFTAQLFSLYLSLFMYLSLCLLSVRPTLSLSDTLSPLLSFYHSQPLFLPLKNILRLKMADFLSKKYIVKKINSCSYQLVVFTSTRRCMHQLGHETKDKHAFLEAACQIFFPWTAKHCGKIHEKLRFRCGFWTYSWFSFNIFFTGWGGECVPGILRSSFQNKYMYAVSTWLSFFWRKHLTSLVAAQHIRSEA